MPDSVFSRFHQAAVHVLTSMVSMEVKQAAGNEPFRMQADVLDVRIVYQGPYTGTVGLVLERNLAKRIASKMLGLQNENDILDDMIDDTARELINVICGRYLTIMYGEKPVLNMSVPLITRVDGKVCRRLLTDRQAYAFRIDGFPVLGVVKPA